MEKLHYLFHLLTETGCSHILVDLELLAFGTLKGVAIHKTAGQVDILQSIELDNEGRPTAAVIRLYKEDSLIKTIHLNK